MLDTLQKTFHYYVRGVRFYIAAATILISLEVWWWVSTAYSGSSLYSIRLTEIYAWLATIYLFTAISIGPVCKIFKKLPNKKVLYDARRLLGVSAAWYASLHVIIAYSGLFKFANPLSLPSSYQQSFALGSVALLVLLAMAFTSFDKAFNGLGIWWFRLHRLVYLAVMTGLLHIFLSGAHASNVVVVSVLAIMSSLLVGMHAFIGFKRGKGTRLRYVSVGTAAILLSLIFLYGFTRGASVYGG